MARVTNTDLMDQVNRILKPFDDLGTDGQKLAVDICKSHQKKLRNEFKDEIQTVKGKNPVYIRGFTTIPLSGFLGVWGCKLWNKKYPLSHLLEDGHLIRNKNNGPHYQNKRGTHGNSVSLNGSTGIGTRYTYGFNLWKKEDEVMCKEFYDGVIKLVEKAGAK